MNKTQGIIRQQTPRLITSMAPCLVVYVADRIDAISTMTAIFQTVQTKGQGRIHAKTQSTNPHTHTHIGLYVRACVCVIAYAWNIYLH